MPLLDNIAIGKRLEMCREKLNVGLTEFSQRAGIDQSHYSKIERGEKPITDNTWDKLYGTYKLDKGFILLGTTIPTPNSYLQLPGPEAGLEQLVKVQLELRHAEEQVGNRIRAIVSGGKDNSGGDNGELHSGKDNKSNKRKYGKR